jgi:hypothetical protein
VSVRRADGNADIATMTISDDGTGFLAKPKANGMVLRWCDDLSNRCTKAWWSTPSTARFGPSKSPSNTWPLPLEQVDATPRAQLYGRACL